MADADPHLAPTQAARPAASGAYRFTLAQYDAMIDAGVFRDGRGAELVRGELVAISPKYLPHQSYAWNIGRALEFAFPAEIGFRVLADVDTLLGPDTVRGPDLVVFRRLPRGTKRMPAQKAVLVVEIAHSTLRDDLGSKLFDYATAGIPHYWIIDIDGACIHCCAGPGADGYAERHVVRFGETAPYPQPGEGGLTIPAEGWD